MMKPGLATAAELNAIVADGDDGLVAYGEANRPDASANAAEFDGEEQLAAIVSLALASSPELKPLAELPAWTIPFLPVDAGFAAATIRRECLSDDGVGRFREVDGALREWLTRAVSAGKQIRVRLVESDAETIPFPQLLPSHPGANSHWVADAVDALDWKTVLPRVASEDDATALRAGLLQVNDFLDRSHEYSQSVQGAGRNAAGDYWHALMHRREPDFSNAKYWYRRVGSHVVFDELAQIADRLFARFPRVSDRWKDKLLPAGNWDAFACVDLCDSCAKSEDDDASDFARRMQWCEMLSLLRQTVDDAAT